MPSRVRPAVRTGEPSECVNRAVTRNSSAGGPFPDADGGRSRQAPLFGHLAGPMQQQGGVVGGPDLRGGRRVGEEFLIRAEAAPRPPVQGMRPQQGEHDSIEGQEPQVAVFNVRPFMGQHGSQFVAGSGTRRFRGEQDRRPQCAGCHGGQQAAIHAQPRPTAAAPTSACSSSRHACGAGSLSRTRREARHTPSTSQVATNRLPARKVPTKPARSGRARRPVWLADGRSLRRRHDRATAWSMIGGGSKRSDGMRSRSSSRRARAP